MSSATLERTGTSFGIDPWLNRLQQSRRTHLNLESIRLEVAAVVSEWEGRNPDEYPYPSTPILAVDFIVSTLKISRREVLEAVEIPEKTYYNWAGQGNTPRSTSTAKLWAMTRIVYMLHEGNRNLASWFHSDVNARNAFSVGDPNALVEAEAVWAIRLAKPVQLNAPDFDNVVDIIERVEPRKRRTSVPRHTTSRKVRRSVDE